MKSAVAVFFAAVAALGAAGPVQRRDACDLPYFQVNTFSAACVQHSVQCVYEFNLVADNQAVKCRTQLVSTGVGELPPVTAGTCDGSARTFTVTKIPDGRLVFTASTPFLPNLNLTGSRVIDTFLLPYQQDGASQAQVYTGPAEFALY